MYQVVSGSNPLITQFILIKVDTISGIISSQCCSGTETVLFLGPKIWEYIRTNIKEIFSPNSFKKVIKQRKPINCP